MTRPELSITPEDAGEVTVLHLNGRLVLGDGDVAFRQGIDDLISRGRLFIVVNFADVSYIDSAGIGMLVGRYLGVRRRGGDVKLAHLTARSHRVMTITQLLHVFDAFDTVEEAVRSFGLPRTDPEVPDR